TLIFSVFPPVESFAAAPKSTFPNKTETMYIGEDYDFTGKATAVGSDISIVHVDIQGPDTQTKGVSYFREEDIGSSTFNYSNIDEFTWGDRLYSCQSNATMETSEPGKYWVIVYTKAEDGYTTTRTHIINLKLETPELSTHDGNEWLPYDEDHTFKWYSVPGASSYEVSVVSYDEKNKAYNIYTNKEVSTSKRSITVDEEDLFAGGALAVYITAYTNSGASSKASYIFPMEYEEKYLTVSDCDDLDPEKGSTAVFYVNTNVDFTVTSSKSWVTWSKVKQDDTHYKITLKATSANTGTSDRSAKITVSGDGVDSESFYVYQLAPEIELPSISNISVSQNVTLGDNISWSAYIDGNGSLLETVTVGVFSEQLSSSIYFRNTNIGKETYSLKGSVLTGGIVNGYDDSGNPKTLNLGLPGNYTVTFHAKTNASKNNYIATTPINITLTEPESTGILGDVNSDGNVNDLDLFVFKRYLDNIEGYTVNITAADITGNGEVTIDDYNILKNYLVSNLGYENLYDFYNPSSSSYKPTISGVNQVYYVNKGDSLTIPFTLIAQNNGKIEKVTMKHNFVGTLFQSQSYECNVNSYSNSFSISGYPLNEVGSHTFVIYCRASNYTVTSNEIIIFTVYVTEKECSHDNYDDQYLRTVYAGLYKTLVDHTYYHESKRVCKECGYEICTVAEDSVTEGHKLNSKGYCLCGYINTSGYAIWEGYNSSGKNVTVYSNPESTSKYGSIYSNECVSVLGECCGRYLIEYKLDSGGIKQGYVEKNTISKTNVNKGLYTLYVQSRYFYKNKNGLAEHGLIAEPGDYFAVKIYDNTQKKYISITSDSKLSWKCREDNATIDKYGTLCVKDACDELDLFYDGELVSSIEIGSLGNLSSYLQTYDSIIENWADKNMCPNNHYIVKDYKSTYNKTSKCYDVTMTVYNKSLLIYGVVTYDSTGKIYDIDYIESDFKSFSYVGEIVDAFRYVPDIFSGDMLQVTSGALALETKIEVSVPLGGHIEFLYPTDNDQIMYANIIQIVFAVLDAGMECYEFKEALPDVNEIVSNKTFREIWVKVLDEYYIYETIRDYWLNTSHQDGAKLLRDFMTFFTSEENKAMQDKLIKALVECFKNSPTECLLGVGEGVINCFIENGIPFAKVVSKGVTVAGDAMQVTSMIISLRNIYNTTSSSGHLFIYYPTSPEGSGGMPF
ncbi:MAG: hypothetical protein IJE40_07290, partial [Clostridia bacterium]|nr:hypothetical protein [Clostridia bacterium]